MAVTKNIMQPLIDIGLSKYEAKVYLTLISEGVTTAKSVSDITGIPYGKVYEIINILSNKGFVMVLPTKPMKYRAVSPQQIIQVSKKNTLEKYSRIEKTIISQLEPLFAKNKQFVKPAGLFWMVNGRSNIVKKTEEFIKKAKSSINICCSAKSLSRLILHKEALLEAKSKNISINIAGVVDKENLPELSSLKFFNLKSIGKAENNFISIDGEECMVIEPKPDDDNIVYGRDLGIYTTSPAFTKFIDEFFQLNFEKAKEIKF
jgi:sugar-specific transcriptional regulator TrmB